MAAALPARHRLARRPRLTLKDLADETFILYRRPDGRGLYDVIITACGEAGFSPHVGQEAPRIVSTLNLVAAGLGITIVPASLSRLPLEGVTYRPLVRQARDQGAAQPRLPPRRTLGRDAGLHRSGASPRMIRVHGIQFRTFISRIRRPAGSLGAMADNHPPPGFEPLFRSSPFLDHLGPFFMRKQADGTFVVASASCRTMPTAAAVRTAAC